MRNFYLNDLDMRPIEEWDRGAGDRGALFVFNGPTSATSVEVLDHAVPGGGPTPTESVRAASRETTAATRKISPEPITVAVEVDNVGAQLEKMVGCGVEITSEIATMPWGHRSFSVRDPDGLEISFFQDMNRRED